MARYFVAQCLTCEGKTSQKLVGYAKNGLQELVCEACGTQNHKTPAQVPKKKTTYPYYNGSAGMTFESESHEMKYAKANNLEKI